MRLRDELAEQEPELLFMDPSEQFDGAIVGIGSRCGMETVVVYDIDLVVQAYINDGMTEEDAIEFFEFNAAGAYLGERTPIFMHRIIHQETS